MYSTKLYEKLTQERKVAQGANLQEYNNPKCEWKAFTKHA